MLTHPRLVHILFKPDLLCDGSFGCDIKPPHGRYKLELVGVTYNYHHFFGQRPQLELSLTQHMHRRGRMALFRV